MAKNSGLGRGLDSLIPVGLSVDDVASPGETIKEILLDNITANPDQPRKHFDESALAELARSIKQHGVIQPIVVTPDNDGYRIVAGERRYRASLQAGLAKIPAIVRDHKELEELEIAIVENVQRVDLSPLEQAVSIVRLHDQFSMSFKEIARKLGKAETTVSNIVRLLQLPKQAIEAMQKKQITEGHARAILAIKTDEKAQLDLLNKIITQKLSVRQAEDWVKSIKSGAATPKPAAIELPPVIKKHVARMPSAVSKRVSIKPASKTTGKVTISYTNNAELQRVLDQLK